MTTAPDQWRVGRGWRVVSRRPPSRSRLSPVRTLYNDSPSEGKGRRGRVQREGHRIRGDPRGDPTKHPAWWSDTSDIDLSRRGRPNM
jgi:hypothetical protein